MEAVIQEKLTGWIERKEAWALKKQK